MALGTYSARITVSGGAGVASETIDVTLSVVKAGEPAIACSKTALAASVAQGGNAPAQSFTVHNSGGGMLSYTVVDDASWLSISPQAGRSLGEHDTINVSFATSTLAAGTYNATITVNAGAGVASVDVPVTLTVQSVSGGGDDDDDDDDDDGDDGGGGGGGGGGCSLAGAPVEPLPAMLPYLLLWGLWALNRVSRRRSRRKLKG
jgi:hypothetical protein